MPPPRGSWNPLEGPGDYDVTSFVHNDTYPEIDSTKANLKGKAVFVVGASKGIGKEVALSFARAGVSHLAVAARSKVSSIKDEIQSVAKEAGKQPPQFLPIDLDITSKSSVDHAAEEVEQVFGRLDILVNVAGTLGQAAKIVDSDPDQWWNTWNVNLRGPYLVCRAFIPLLLKGGLKTIVNVSSVGAHIVRPTLNAYQPSKLAVLRFSEFAAKEYAEDGLICFSVHPGNIVTDILLTSFGGIPKGMEHIFVDTPRLPADSIVFLTGERRDWLSGRYINCTWDMPELIAKKDEIVEGDKLKVRLIF
ncbi:putative short-chain type dehydrogenase [Rhizodiscina lignyota]|uniref:Short-chain type dehydrogenase n=1 Tax=Rhizodiscina lignyota TaxID=1504668 RepID=A0A9P4M721_9PEZI|nr:putative short-chain type dehydrogenase [Rhizodiscina lignyota]